MKREYTGSTIVYSQDQSIEEVGGSSSSDSNTHASYVSDRRALEDFDDEEMEEKQQDVDNRGRNIQVKTDAAESKKINFRLEDVCVEGNTMLWDIVQDKNAVSLLCFCWACVGSQNQYLVRSSNQVASAVWQNFIGCLPGNARVLASKKLNEKNC